MVRFLCGRARSGKTRRVITEMTDSVCRRLVLLVPEQYSHSMERLLCASAGARISRTAEVLSFKQMSERVFARAGNLARRVPDRGARILMMQRALSQAGAGLKTFSASTERPEFLSTLIDTAEELKTCRIKPESLMDITDGALGDKLCDIARICAAYDGMFAEGEIDAADELTLVAQGIESCSFFSGTEVWIDGFSGFTPQEYEILKLIFAQSDMCTVTLCLNNDADDECGAFKKPWDTFNKLKRFAGDCKVIKLDTYSENIPQSLAHLEKNVFRQAPEICDSCEGVELYRVDGIYEECATALARATELVRDGGMRYRDICICARGFDAYADMLEAMAKRYDIPIYLNRKAQLLDRAPVAFITSALACACGGFRYDDVIKYLKTGLCGVSRRELDRLENYLFTWDVRGNMWTREDGFSQGDEKTTAGEHIDSPLQAINRTRARIRTPLCELKSALAGQTTGREFATALFEFMEHVGLARRLAARARLSRMRGELQLEDEYRRLWDILIDAVGTIAHVLPDTVLKSDKFGELFTLLISQYEIGVIPVSLDRISVGDLDRTENTTPRAVIILGACDGNLPMSSDGTGIFTDAEKERLCELGVSLPATADARMFDEFRIIYGAFTKASEQLIIISPRTGSDMSERRESFIIPRIRAIFPKLEYSEYAAPQTQAQAPCFDFALSRGDDPWQYAAREYFKDDARLEQAMRNASLKRSPVHDIDNIRAIFGDTIRLSASRTDTFSSCRYHYFLQYGLRLKPRRVKGLDAPQIGTFIHFVLEHTLRGVKLRGGHHAVCADDVTRLADEAIEEFANTQLGGFRDRSARFIYLFKRLKKTVHAVVLDVHEELSQSKFAPLDFELHFSDHDGDLPAMHLRGDGYELKLEGFVDRVDGYKIDDVLYLRVVDYKTGKREFSLNEVINGLNMQLLLYLFTLCECGQERYGAELLPGGALYVPARDPIVFASNNEEGGLARASELRRRGIILQDTRLIDDSAAFLPIKLMKNGEFDKRSFVASLDGFNIIKTRIKNILGEIGKELSHGEIEANPYYKSLSETACDYCEYKSACHFDEACGDRRRYLFEKKMEGC